jgi:hypothetical protein
MAIAFAGHVRISHPADKAIGTLQGAARDGVDPWRAARCGDANTSRCAEIEERFPGLLLAIVDEHTIQSKDEAQAKKFAAKRSSRRFVKNK